MPRFTEKSVVEDYIIEQLQNKGWNFVKANELNRESYEEPLLIPELEKKIRELNQDKGIGDEEVKHALNEIKLRSSGMEGSKQILNYFKHGIPVKFEKERVVKYVQLFDFDDITNNELTVSRQVVYQGRDEIRTDIILYVNGIPLADIECKNPTSFSENWYHAYRQIKDYEGLVPELYKYVQIGIAAEDVVKYFPIVPWQEDVKKHQWVEERKDPVDSIIEMLSPESFLDILKYYLFFRVERDEATKVIPRYMQYRASEKIVNRVIRNLKGEVDKDRGLIWHWQGSGKTLTMIFAANKLYHENLLENPSIFFIVDRIELEEQLYQEFYSLDIVEPEIIGSIDKLRKNLRHDEGRGKRGIMLTLIHKFRPEELENLQKELEESDEKETILTRKNILGFIDEGHRTQYGTLAAQMKDILRNAFFFAFTGTPISKRGRDSYLEFSYPPEEKYLDKYFLTESNRDGFTKKLIYQPRLEEEVHLKKEMLETFLEVEFEELPEKVKEEVEEGVKRRLSAIKLFLENPEYIKKKAEDITKHFEENVDGKFKAMVVAGSRKACVRYKRFLDELLPEEYSDVVMTFERDDEELIQNYKEDLKEKYGDKKIDEIKKEIVENFKEEEYPRILIVTDMLLTGFDAPILQTMYLDKPLKEHRLLQAIARTNRPYNDVKVAGLIVDYVGILKEFKRAFEIYAKEEIEGVLSDIEAVREDFNTLLDELLGMFEDIPKDEYDRRTLLKAIEVLTTEEEKGKEFLEKYKQLRKIFELLGPDQVKARRFTDYKWLSAIYTYYMKRVIKSQPSYTGYIEKYYDKTVKFVHKTTELERLDDTLPVIEFGEDYLQKLEEKAKSNEEKAADIVFTLNRLVLVDRHKNPVYESLADKVERLLKRWKEKTKDYESIYTEGAGVINEINELHKRQKDLGFSDMEYSLLLALEEELGKERVEKDVKQLSEHLANYIFSGWINQATARKEVEREVRRFVRKYVRKYDLSLDKIDEIHHKLMERIENYGR